MEITKLEDQLVRGFGDNAREGYIGRRMLRIATGKRKAMRRSKDIV